MRFIDGQILTEIAADSFWVRDWGNILHPELQLYHYIVMYCCWFIQRWANIASKLLGKLEGKEKALFAAS